MWLPVPHTEMSTHLRRFKKQVQKEAEKTRKGRIEEAQQLSNLQFKYKDRVAFRKLAKM